MADTQKTDLLNELGTVLDRIASLLHGTIASVEFFSDEQAEINMIHLAKDTVRDAKAVVERLYQCGQTASGKEG